MNSISIHQPEYIPWFHLFEKISLSDEFVFLDDVQYLRRGFQSRNKILTAHGEKWLTIPTIKQSRGSNINEIKLDNSQEWQKRHFNIICESYKKSKFFLEIKNFLEPFYEKKFENLYLFNAEIVLSISKNFGLKTKFCYSSELKSKYKKSDKILDICKKKNAKLYITGQGSKNYLDDKKFINDGIKVKYLKPYKLIYKQISNNFIPDLSILDYLFHNGFKNFLLNDYPQFKRK